MKRHLIILYIVALACVKAGAQEEVSFNHYWALPSLYNPAAAAVNGKLNVQAAYSNQMSGFENCPKTLYAGVDLPIYFLSPAHSAGVCLLNDQSGLFKHTRISLQYAYHHRFGQKLKVSGGLRLTLTNESFDGSKVDVADANDIVVATSNVKGTAFDLDFGLRVDYNKQWYAGVSVLRMLAPQVDYGDDKKYQYNTSSTFYLTGGYNIKFRSPLFNMQLDAIVRSDLSLWRGDMTARLNYNGERHHLYFGAAYSPTNSVSVLFGGDFHGITLGYCYEIYTSAIGFVHGTHEIMLGYQVDLDLFKKGKNLHKSVRHL